MHINARSVQFRGLSIFTLAVIFVVFVPSLRTAAKKPSPPTLSIKGNNIVTWDYTNFLRVWEKDPQGEAYRLAWTSARCHENWTIDVGDVTGDGKKDIVGALGSYGEDENGGFYQGRFEVYTEGSTGYPSYISEPIGRGDYSSTFIRRVYVADATSDYVGNEVVLLTDNDLAVFSFNGTGFIKIAELSEMPSAGTFWDCAVGDLDGDSIDEIAVSVHTDPGQVWIYKYNSGNLDRTGELVAADYAGYMHQQIRVADVSGDGNLDIMAYSRKSVDGCSHSYFNTWIKNGGGYDRYIQPIDYYCAYRIFSFDAGDLDGDSKAEVAIEIPTPQGTEIQIWEWTEPSFVMISTHNPGRSIVTLTISDFGGGPARIIMSGSIPDIKSPKSFYLGVFEIQNGFNLSSLWKFEGNYYRARAHGND